MYCLGALQRGQWLTSLYLKDAYFHVGVNPAGRSYLHFRHDGTSWQLTVVSEHLPKCSNQYTLPPGEIARVPGRPGDIVSSNTPRNSRANILAQVPVPKATNLDTSDLTPSHVAIYIGIELDTLVVPARPSDKNVTNWLSTCIAEEFMAQQPSPAVQWLQVLGQLVSHG